jgi:cyclopropane-fatty-acyl-phospholipid synthase
MIGAATISARAATRLPPAARVMFALLERIERGALTLTTPDGVTRRFGNPARAGPLQRPAALTVQDWRLFRELLAGGDIAFADAYIDGRCESPDLTALLTVIACNQHALGGAFYTCWWRQLGLRLKHLLRTNTRRQARRNIVAHYDLGNDFYHLWLDPTMTYSAALFGGDATQSLQSAQTAKYSRILRELALPRCSRLLEIGCGWGGFAEVAARAGLADRVDFRIQDYRDMRGRFDGVASIEMFEAVGERYWPTFFDAVRDSLRPGARACVQTITIVDERFEQYRRHSDFVQQTIFPGGMLASPARFRSEAQRAGLSLQVDAVRDLGFDSSFIHCWRFYLAYCAAGFDSDTTDVAQYTLMLDR